MIFEDFFVFTKAGGETQESPNLQYRYLYDEAGRLEATEYALSSPDLAGGGPRARAADRLRIRDVPAGKEFLFLFDYGDEWHFAGYCANALLLGRCVRFDC